MALKGDIFDVAVDIRKRSPTYGRWTGVRIFTEKIQKLVYIPPGFAHGFCVLSDEADVIYKVTVGYKPALDKGIFWDDPTIGIQWPLSDPIISPKDAHLPLLKDAEIGF